MAGRPGVKVDVTADDSRLNSALDRINKRLALLRLPAERAQKSMSKFAQLSGLTRVQSGIGRITSYSKEAFFALGRIVPVLGTLTGAASIAGVVRLATAWGDFGSRLGFSAQRIGITAGRLQALDGAAELAGSSAGSLQSGMQTLGDGMWAAVGGRAPELVSTFRALHVNFQDLHGRARSVADVMPELADKIAAIRDPYAQAAVAARLFGGASEDLLPFLRLGSAGIARYTAMAAHYGVTNQKGVDAANRLRMAQTELSLATRGLGYSIAEALAPGVTWVVHWMSEWIANHRALIQTKLEDYIKRLVIWVRQVWPEVEHVATALGGWKAVAKDALEAITALFAVRVLTGLATLASALGGVGLAMRRLSFAAPIAALIETAVRAQQGRALTAEDLQRNPSLGAGLTPEQLAQVRATHAADPFAGLPGYGRFRHGAEALTGYGSAARPRGGRLNADQHLSDLIDAASGMQGVDPAMVRALIHRESGGRMVASYDPTSTAFGYMQLTDPTAKDEGVDSHDPGQNILGGTAHFARALKLASGNLAGAAAAYHDGLNSAGAAWLRAHPGDLSHFSQAGQDEGRDVAMNYAAERGLPQFGRPPPQVDPGHPMASRGARARADLHALAAREGIITSEPAVTPPWPVSPPPDAATPPPAVPAQGRADATVADNRSWAEKLRIEVVHVNPPAGARVRVTSPDKGVRVAAVSTVRAMDPASSPGGF